MQTDTSGASEGEHPLTERRVGLLTPTPIVLWDHLPSVYLAALGNTDTCRQPGGGSQFYPLLAGLLCAVPEPLSLSLHVCKMTIGNEADSSGGLHTVSHTRPTCKCFFPSAVGREGQPRSLSRPVRTLHDIKALGQGADPQSN